MGYVQYHKIVEVRVMVCLEKVGPLTATQLALKLYGNKLSASTRVMPALKELEEAQYVARAPTKVGNNIPTWLWFLVDGGYDGFMETLIIPHGRFE